MRSVFVSLFIVFSHLVNSQIPGLNNALKILLEEKNAPGFVCDILVEGDMAALSAAQYSYGFRLNYYAGDVASITCNIKTIPRLLQNKLIRYAEYIKPNRKLMNDTMVYRNRIKGVKLWTAPLPQAYNGEGVMLGVIDSGVDVVHKDLRDSLNKTRIKYLWDQVPAAGSSIPQPFNYGIEWTAAQINANQCTHSGMGFAGHGTGVCGIAAGNGLANGTHQGVASKADIVMVAVDFSRSGPVIADAVNYIFTKAAALGKPCSINISLGDYYGSHDGTDLETKLIENMLKNKPGRVVVAAAGNAGGIKFHVKSEPPVNDTVFTWLQNPGTLSYWCYADTQQIKQVKLSVGANRLNYSSVGNIGFKAYNYALTSVKNDTLKNALNKRVGLVKSSASINSKGVYELYMEITPDSTNLLWRVETTGSGKHHAWNFDFVSSGLPTAAQYPRITKYAMPDTLSTMVSGFQCSEEIITVGNYNNLYRYYDVNSVLQTSGVTGGQLTASSSQGPTRDGRIKPDITATGDFVFTTLVTGLQPIYIANQPSIVAQGSMHVLGGGTSAASPVVAGLAALYLQRYPNAGNQQIRVAVRNCAYADAYTGSALPNSIWGFGKLDGKATMYCGETVYNALTKETLNGLSAFPNPFKQLLTLTFKKSITGKIYFYTANGSLLAEDSFTDSSYKLKPGILPDDYEGLLLVKIDGDSGFDVIKLIKEK